LQVLSNEEQEKVYKTFKAFDQNNDGRITKDELINGYRKFYRDLPEKEILIQVERLFKKGDPDNKGYIGYSEWQMATIDKLLLL
jgi:calcium-dependent protein kinase